MMNCTYRCAKLYFLYSGETSPSISVVEGEIFSRPLLAQPFNDTSSIAHFLPFLLSIFTIFVMRDPFTPPGKHVLARILPGSETDVETAAEFEGISGGPLLSSQLWRRRRPRCVRPSLKHFRQKRHH